MAVNLARAGFEVAVWNRTASRAQALISRGVRVASTVRDALSHADAAIVMLSTGPVVDQALFAVDKRGDRPIEALRPGSLLIVMSSIPVDHCRQQANIAKRLGVAYVDAPVSGGETGAKEATLAIMAGGSEDAIERASRLFRALGRVTRIGDTGTGQLAKLANQIIVGITVAAVAEALHFARSGGADPAAVRQAILGGFADSAVLRQHGLRMVGRAFQPGGVATYQLKDLRTASANASALGLELPMLTAAESLFAAMVANGDGDLDHSAVIQEIERRGPAQRRLA
jgi:3-hydroxyisobutyrate dehydrogenase-like beta-hydroxyacid dehydrogenase